MELPTGSTIGKQDETRVGDEATGLCLGEARQDPAPCQLDWIHAGYSLCLVEILQDLGTVVSGCLCRPHRSRFHMVS